MGEIIGAISCDFGPDIPSELIGKIEVRATYPIDQREAKIFTLALQGITAQIKHENKDFNELNRVCALLTEKGDFSYINDNALGYRIHFIVFCVGKWRNLEYGDYNILTVYLEELCHQFWNIEDEEEVKYKVVEVTNRIFEHDIGFNDLYSPNWKEAYPGIYFHEQ